MFDAARDVYHCPGGRELPYESRETRNGVEQKRYRCVNCDGCPLAALCLQQKNGEPATGDDGRTRTIRRDAHTEVRERAAARMATPESKAFAVDQEPDVLRDRYGRNEWGQACLLARRLAESGTLVVNIYFNTPKSGQEFTNWDDHISNAGRPGHFAKYMRVRLPYMDQALSALIEDIFDRGLDRKVLVVVVGEFGRTPRLSHNSTGTGCDYWLQAYTALLSGGGLHMGQVVGATNRKAEYPAELPHTPQDLLATIYRHLGIDPATPLTDYSGPPRSGPQQRKTDHRPGVTLLSINQLLTYNGSFVRRPVLSPGASKPCRKLSSSGSF